MVKSWKFPVEFNRYSNAIETTENRELIRQSLRILVSTVPGERYLEPSYGFDLSVLAFSNLTLSEQTKFKGDLKHAIESFEPRVRVDSLLIKNSNTKDVSTNILIEYTIIETNLKDQVTIEYNI